MHKYVLSHMCQADVTFYLVDTLVAGGYDELNRN